MSGCLLAWTYILRLRSGRLYVGCTTDLRQRLEDHRLGRACRTTSIDRPVGLLRVERCTTFAAARIREAQIKRWTASKKEALATGDLIGLQRLARRRRS